MNTLVKQGRLWWSGAVLSALMAAGAPAQAALQPALKAVESVDLSRYQGRWYQIAYYPNTFQKQCVSHTTADYALLSNGQVEVTNACKTAEGSTSSVVGLARLKQLRFLGVPVSKPVTSKLEVRFAPDWLSWVPGVWANYWVIQLASDYRYAVVGEPNRQFLWILSRTPTLSAQDDAAIRATLVQQGYDPLKLRAEPQN
ncbi:MAG TPA: lipocalin family protein [Aquabacterium sp.]|uniref:lipocalin family protein n=1 Tax=Aquabacterium sp. TaxID=1872578 RepID=UPI002E3320DA|nr:lipocalin family protein [Aquabacterium sp.]HEX5373928.1 lipocalin family protein [Aquabacterium sp.]